MKTERKNENERKGGVDKEGEGQCVCIYFVKQHIKGMEGAGSQGLGVHGTPPDTRQVNIRQVNLLRRHYFGSSPPSPRFPELFHVSRW